MISRPSAATKNIHAFGLDWHVSGRSAAFHKLLVEPLQPYARVTFQTDTMISDTELPRVFCQVIPPDNLPRSDNIIWIPMWDHVRKMPQSWWNSLPKALRIVAFSDAVQRRARQAGLRCLRLTYYENPATWQPATWDQRVLYYWNRQGLVSPALLERLCAALRVDRLIFRAQIDPGIDQRASYTLPSQLGSTQVEILDASLAFDEYRRITSQANLVIAPRLYEGVGLVALEALARGCVVFAHAAPVMNEYIEQGETGVFLNRGWSAARVKVAVMSRVMRRDPPFTFLLPDQQDWETIAAIDAHRIGATARAAHLSGYLQWQAAIPGYARFILDA